MRKNVLQSLFPLYAAPFFYEYMKKQSVMTHSHKSLSYRTCNNTLQPVQPQIAQSVPVTSALFVFACTDTRQLNFGLLSKFCRLKG